MKVNPQTVFYRKSIDFDFQNLDSPTLNHKNSTFTYDTDAADKVNATYGTLNSPQNIDEVQQINFKKQVNQCRICLQNSIQSPQQLLSLCKCSGSVEYIHQKCFKQWIQKSMKVKKKEQKKSIIKLKQIECQMCKQKISLSFQDVIKLKSCNNIAQSIKIRPKIFGFITTMFLIGLLLLIYIIVMMTANGLTFNSQESLFLQSVLMLASLILLILLCCVTCGYIIEQFFIQQEIKVDKVFPKRNIIDMKRRKVSTASSGQSLSLSPYSSPLRQRKIRPKKQTKSSLGNIIQVVIQQEYSKRQQNKEIDANMRSIIARSQFQIKRITQNEQQREQI